MSRLITKDKAVKCVECGEPIWRPASTWYAKTYGEGRLRDGKKRLGYEPMFRMIVGINGIGKAHWNGKQCQKRKEQTK